MFGKLVRAVVGGAQSETQDSGKPRIDDILSIPSLPLRAWFEDCLRGEVADRAAEAQRAQSACAAAFADDPMAIAFALVQRAPIMTMLGNSDPRAYSRLKAAFQSATELARRAAVDRHGRELPITDQQLPMMLRALGVIVAQGGTDMNWGYGTWLEPVVRVAGSRPAYRQALLEMFESFGRGQVHRDTVASLIEKLLPHTTIPREAVALLAEHDREDAKRDAVRARIQDDAGPVLWTAIEAVLDGAPGIGDFSLRTAEKHPALKSLADQSPEARGADFVRMLDIAAGLARNVVGEWGALQRHSGRYRHGSNQLGYLPGIGNVLGALATRKMVLAEPDRDAARLARMLPDCYNLTHRKLLAFLLETATAHPQGATVPALRALIAAQGTNRFSEWVTEIEDVLRDLPAAAPAQTQSPPPTQVQAQTSATLARFAAAAGPGGFGRKGLGDAPAGAPPPAAPAAVPAAVPIPGLAPIALPDFTINQWLSWGKIDHHFDALFDVRLHDAAHRDFLTRLAALADSIDTLPTEDRRGWAAAVAALAKGSGCTISGDNDPGRLAAGIAQAAKLGRNIARRFAAFAPFVTADPEMARKLGKHAQAIAGKSAPTAKWLAEGRTLIAEVPAEQRVELLRTLVQLAPPAAGYGGGEHIQRALIYLSADLDPASVAPMLTEFALKTCYQTVPGQGIRAEKLGNAAVWALAAMPGGAGVPYLARILARTKYPKIRAKVDEKLNEAAAAAGVSRGALDELSVPTHDLDRDGELRLAVGGGEAVLRIDGSRDVAIEWRADGKVLKAPSVAMKADKEALKAAREAAKEIEADLGTLIVRLQRLYLEDRSWDSAEWRERYLEHPLVRCAARRLIWRVDTQDGASRSAMADAAGGTLVDVAGQAVPLDGATIRLWHPIEAEIAEVEAWRSRLEAEELVQPFAQAWREVYAITEAERTTATYSNRWAAHLLKQHQAMTLARLNGWRVTHRMWVDAPNDQPWHLMIPAHGLVVDYWVEGAGGEDPEVSESGAYAYVATDRVQFHPVAADAGDSAVGPARGRAVALADVPPLVFSEVMRQVDLLSAVASIAADPNWLDGGADAAHPNQWRRDAAAYWGRINGAELEESGKRRRAVLERIVPRLKIADRLSLDDRYLLVEGKLHSYRIHLGSGACFRGERHMCIVPKIVDGGGSRVWLPFEGDRTLSIILSKALLLSEDDKIKDPVIRAQL